MSTIALHLRTKILPGNRIELTAPELPEGQFANVFVVVDDLAGVRQPLWQNLGDYTGGQLFRSAAEVETYLQSERASWES